MASPVKPALVRAQAAESWIWVPAIADINSPSIVELNAATGFNLSCSVFGEQEGVTATTEKVTLPRRLCEDKTFEVNGATSYSAPDFTISFDPQGAALSDGKKAWEAMDDNANGFMVQRQGVASTADLTVGEFFNVFPAQLGTKMPGKTSTGADGVFAFTVGVSITDTPALNVAAVA